MSRRARAELVIEGRVATLAGEAGFGWIEALAIGGGLVLAAGGRTEVDALADRQTLRWRLPADQLVVPGITDAHLHLLMMILAQQQVDLSGAADLAETLETVAAEHRDRTAAGNPDGWLLGHGWLLDRLGGWPDAAMLERACPGRPIALYAHDHHSRWLSAEGLRRAGIDASVSDPPGGLIRRDETGNPTGILHETATGLVDRAIPEPSEAQLEAGLRREAADYAALGITGCHDPGELGSEPDIARGTLLYRRLAATGRLPLRVHGSVRAPQLTQAIELGLVSGQGVEPESDDPAARRTAARYRMGWLKLFTDGSLGSRSAALLEPYSDADSRPPTGGPRGMLLAGREQFAHELRRAAAAGISSQLHAIGDAAVRLALDLLAEHRGGPLMPRIEHAQLVDPADQPRFGQLGVAASVQPVHLRTDAPAARIAWGKRAEHAFPLRGLATGAALIPFGSDAPVEPVDPWPGIAVAVLRRDPQRPQDEPLGAGHGLTLARALRAACLDPALVAGEQRLGRLFKGCRADLLVVPAAGFAEPLDAAQLASTRPVATLIDGELVYRAPDFDMPWVG